MNLPQPSVWDNETHPAVSGGCSGLGPEGRQGSGWEKRGWRSAVQAWAALLLFSRWTLPTQVQSAGAAVQPQQSPGGPEGAMRRQRVEIRQLHSSEAGEALIRLLQVQVDFYIFFFGID